MADEHHKIDNIKVCLDHAWAWFALHATQRLQLVNFFLVAIAFLSAAFVTAAKEQLYLLAGSVAVLAVSLTYCFYRVELRIRRLLHAAEDALKPLQEILANIVHVDGLSLVSRVEEGRPGEWKYSKVFRYMYFVTGMFFTFGLLYVWWLAAQKNPPATQFNILFQAVLGMFLMFAGYELLSESQRLACRDASEKAAVWAFLFLGATCFTAGLFVICHLVFVRL
jgi:hypothetical protein